MATKTFYDVCSDLFHQTIDKGVSSGMSVVSGRLHEMSDGKDQKVFEISVSFSVMNGTTVTWGLPTAGGADADPVN